MDKSFDTLARDYIGPVCTLVGNMALCREEDEVERIYDAARKHLTKYAKELRKFIEECNLQATKDHAGMTKVLNDRFGLDPAKASLGMDMKRNTIRWTVHFFDGRHVDIWYMSKRGVPVDMDKWTDWLSDQLQK